ncbi:MAG: DUF5936 domain-containing protein, partial [Nocardioidaceae bacterium]
MSELMNPLLIGMVFTGLFVLATVGLRLARADALSDWDVEDIMLLRDQSRRRRRRGPLDSLAERLAPRLADLLGPSMVQDLRRRIELAGRPNGMTVTSFLQLVVKYALFMGACALVLLLLGNVIGGLIALVAAPLLPLSRLAGQQRRRRERIDADLPDFLDVLSVTVSAGIGFRSALARVSQRFTGPLRDEMRQTLHQLDVGVPRRQAFSALRDRCGSEPMDTFVSAFLQAEELGSPLAETLSTISGD